jgi:hypothetical protein
MDSEVGEGPKKMSRKGQRQLITAVVALVSSLIRVALRWGGWIILGILLLTWKSLDLAWLASLIAAAALYFMFRVPAWCSAMTRQNMLCRNNAYGLLMGCHLREHRWQKLKMAIVPRAWRALMARVWRQNRAQSVGLLLTAVASMAAAVQAVAAVLWRK